MKIRRLQRSADDFKLEFLSGPLGTLLRITGLLMQIVFGYSDRLYYDTWKPVLNLWMLKHFETDL